MKKINRYCPHCNSDDIGATVSLLRTYNHVDVDDVGNVNYEGWGSPEEDEVKSLFCGSCGNNFQAVEQVMPTLFRVTVDYGDDHIRTYAVTAATADQAIASGTRYAESMLTVWARDDWDDWLDVEPDATWIAEER